MSAEFMGTDVCPRCEGYGTNLSPADSGGSDG